MWMIPTATVGEDGKRCYAKTGQAEFEELVGQIEKGQMPYTVMRFIANDGKAAASFIIPTAEFLAAWAATDAAEDRADGHSTDG